MSLDDPTPTEYFGPHAKRWTNPDTGVTMSLSPQDYVRAVAKEQLRKERVEEAVSAAWNDEALDEGVVTIDRLGDPRAAPMAGLFNQPGTLEPASGWNPPPHQRYDLNEFSRMAQEAEDAAAAAAAAARSAEASRDKAMLARGEVRFLSLSEDDTFGLIRPVESAPGEPAARHFRRHNRLRIAAAIVLVYIIAVIGVAAVAAVMS